MFRKKTNFFVDSKIQKELKASIQSVYGKERADEIYNNLIEHAKTAIKNRPQKLKKQDVERTSNWFKNEIIYMFYVDQFGIIQKDKNNTFEDTALMLDYLQELGLTNYIFGDLFHSRSNRNTNPSSIVKSKQKGVGKNETQQTLEPRIGSIIDR